MFQRRRNAVPLAALASLLATLALSSPAHADLVLVVADPAHSGLVATDGSSVNFAPATANPVRVLGAGGRSSMQQNGAQIMLSLEVIGGGFSSTGTGPQSPYFGSIPIQILGTSGEAAGTPVTLRLESNIGGTAPASSVPQLFVNGANYAPSQKHLIEGLKIGDTFRYWAVLSGTKTSANFLSILSVEPADGGELPPRPGKQITITAPDEDSTHPTAPARLEVQLAHRSQATGFRAYLNRHEITHKFVFEGQPDGHAGLSQLAATVLPEDGLRRGRNKLRVEVLRRNGALAKATQTFVVEGPTANAGADQKLKIGQTAWLDGSQSLSALPLSHRWVLTHKPEGSNATLSDPSSAKPSFVPDVNGSYVARLVVHDGHFRSERDTVTISASPASLLVPVKTALSEPDGSYIIKIGDKEYKSDPAAIQDGLQMLALSAATLAPTAQGTFATGPGSSFDPIKNFLNARQTGEIVIISSPQLSGLHNAELGALLAGDGTTPGFGANSEIGTLDSGAPFTFIGVKGYKYDQAFQTGSPDPNYTGYFLQDATGHYKYFQRDFVKFQIKDPANPDTITVGDQVYTAPPLPPGFQGGFHVLVVDRYSLLPMADGNGQPFNRTYFTGTYPSGSGQAEQMAADLNAVGNQRGNSVLFFISSLGQPGYAQPDSAIFQVFNDNNTLNHGNITITCQNFGGVRIPVSSGQFVIGTSQSLLYNPHYVSVGCPADYPQYLSWSWTHTGSEDSAKFVRTTPSNVMRHGSLPAAIGLLGGNPSVIATLGPNDTYALVGAISPGYKNAPPFPSVESSSLITPDVPGGAIRGLLGRGHRGGYYEATSSNFDLAVPTSDDLQIIAWQDPVSWPASDSAGEQAAYKYISQHAACADQDRQCFNDDIRGSYVGATSTGVWDSRLENLTYPQTSVAFSEADFTKVKGQLDTEFGYVQEVLDLRTQLMNLLVDQDLIALGYLTEVAQQVIDATKPKPTSSVAINILKAVGGIAQIASAAIPGTQVAVKAISGVLGAAFNLSASLASTPPGTIDGRIDTTVGQLSGEATKNFVALSSGVSLMTKNILSDWAKLEFVGSRRASSNHPEWRFDPSESSVTRMLDVTVRRHYYERLMPLAYPIWQKLGASANTPAEVSCEEWDNSKAPADTWAGFFDYRKNDQPPGAWSVFVVAGADNESPPNYPSFASTLFNPYDLDGLAIPKMEFFTRWSFHYQHPCD